jgi:hypothetical protein
MTITYNLFGLHQSEIGESFSGASWIAGSYENDAGFREFARAQIAEGNLTVDRLRELLADPNGSIELAELGERGKRLESERKSILAKYALAK